jgi:hypothetical protein
MRIRGIESWVRPKENGDLAVTRRWDLVRPHGGPRERPFRPATVVLDREGVVRWFPVSSNFQVRRPGHVLRAVVALWPNEERARILSRLSQRLLRATCQYLRWRRARDSNPQGACAPVDFKSTALPVEASPPSPRKTNTYDTPARFRSTARFSTSKFSRSSALRPDPFTSPSTEARR